MGNRKKSRNPKESNDDDFYKEKETEGEVLDLHTDTEEDWLTNAVWKDAKKRATKTKPAKEYSPLEICLLGIERIISHSRTEEFEFMTVEAIENQKKVADMYRKKFFDQSVNGNTMNAVDLVKQNDIIQKFEHRFDQVMNALNSRLISLNADSSNSTHVNETNNIGSSLRAEIKVEKIKVDAFNGDVKKWPQFKSTFEECFHNRGERGAIKFYHLMNHLEKDSDPYNAVCMYDRTDKNYDVAWKALCDLYDNERKIVNDIVLSFVDMPSISETPSRSDLINLVSQTNVLTECLPKYKIDVKSWDPILVPLLLRKLDGESIRLWTLERNQKQIAQLQPLIRFIKKRADCVDSEFKVKIGNESRTYISARQNSASSSFVSKRPSFRGPENSTLTSNAPDEPMDIKKKKLSCFHCNAEHLLLDCQSFQRMSEELQEERLRALHLCTVCLRRDHTADKCKRRNCNCGKAHNQILCSKRKKVSNCMACITTSPTVMNIDASLIATIMLIASDGKGNQMEVRAMSDGGSHMNMITERLAQLLCLDRNKLSIPLEGAGRYNIQSKFLVDLLLSPSKNGSNAGEWIRAGVLKTISDRLPVNQFDISDWKHIHGLPLADTKFNMPGNVDILLSVEFMARIQSEGLRRDVQHPERPIADNTTFGWIIYGALPATQNYASVAHLALADSQRIADGLEKLWQIDAVKEEPLLTSDEALCKEMFSKNISRADDGRYCVAMPIMLNPPKLGNSIKAAIARQLQNEKRFRKDPILKENYVKDLQQFLDMDHMELVPDDEIHLDDEYVYYIPHHAANSNKFRVVFDGSVKTSSGVSLNDILLNGPQSQEPLTSIIMRFRTHCIALTTDITKMYRQILVPKNQRNLLRIVWREDEMKPLKHYRLKTQTYGLKSSAYCCIETLRRCAIDYKDEFPSASEAVLKSFYVDDGTLGADTSEEAEELYRQLNLMLGKGRFPLAKWTSNDKRMQRVIGATAKSVNLDLFNENSVLGIVWSVTDDTFKYKLNLKQEDCSPTKRNIVASIAQLYDPNGWISPIVIAGKILIQDIWRSACNWDDVVSTELQRKWLELRKALTHISSLSIPRWIGFNKIVKIELHGFADASTKAYGTAFYARVERLDIIICLLIASKTRVAPLKGMTIPRLELCAALMLAQQSQQICEVHQIESSDLVLHSDSSIVLHWISKCPAGMKTFIGNRVAEIQQQTKNSQWRHVRTQDNPADLASRGVLANELVDNSLWFHGPSWLVKHRDEWPVSNFTVDKRVEEETIAEQKPLKVMAITKREIKPRIDVAVGDGTLKLLLDRCSSMMKLVRVTARVMRFIDIKIDKKQFESVGISKSEYLKAQTVWIKFHQNKYFAKEIELLKANKQIGRDSPILKMTPFIDGDGILRVGGRIKRSTMPFDTKHPIILNSECRFSHLLALEAHQRTLHGGNQLCMQYIRQRFWMITVRKAIKRVTLKCVQCFRQRKEVASQLMGDLPSTRITSGYPFESVGIDYCGPIVVKERSGRTKKTYKSYIAVFICMKTRAVHLDLVTDLTTDAFMASLTRLTSLRGNVLLISSDNATTFHGAANELKLIHKHWTEVANSEALQLKQIKWQFITPMTPSQGGLWERAVRSSKHHLRRVLGTQILTYEEYATVLAHVSACLNSRPLIALDDDPLAAEALTPAHLILGRRLIGPTQFDYTEIPDNRLQRWRLIQKIVQQFWLQWQTEYVTQMIERPKHREVATNVKVGAIVLIRMDNMPPTHWPLGRVTAVFPGDDGHIRNVEVRINNATYRRGLAKIAILPINDNEAE